MALQFLFFCYFWDSLKPPLALFNMKRLLFVFFILLLSYSSFSQSLVAKLKYEDAETAYQQGDYVTTISKLNDAETLLKSSNPRILYLRIMALYKQLESEPPQDFIGIEKVRQFSTQYLAKYETLPNNEDKFRDIYKVSEAMNKYPATAEEFFKIAGEKAVEKVKEMERLANLRRAEEERRIAAKLEEERLDKPAETLQGLFEQFKFKLGLTLEEFTTYNPEAKDMVNLKKTSKIKKRNYWDGEYNKKGAYQISTIDNKVIGYKYIIAYSKDALYLENIYNSYKDLFFKLKPGVTEDISEKYKTRSLTIILQNENIFIRLFYGYDEVEIDFTDYSSIGK